MAAVSILGWFPQSAQYMVLRGNTELEHTFKTQTTAEWTRILFSKATSAAKEFLHGSGTFEETQSYPLQGPGSKMIVALFLTLSVDLLRWRTARLSCRR